MMHTSKTVSRGVSLKVATTRTRHVFGENKRSLGLRVSNLFTGIVQGKAQIKRIDSHAQEKVVDWGDGPQTFSMRTFEVSFPKDTVNGNMGSVQIGASIALNGTCLTVTEKNTESNTATFDIVEETLKRTNLGYLQENACVNFERSAKVGDEIGGHTVSGHVQTTALIETIDVKEDGTARMDFRLKDPFWKKYIIQKGFVAVDGCSLTVGETSEEGFCVYLIPETLRVTVLGEKKVGDFVNIEVEAQTQAIVDTVERVLAERNL